VPSELADPLGRLLSQDPDEQAQALSEIVAMGEAVAAPLEALVLDQDAHPRYRAGAINALGRIGATRSATVLETLWERGLEVLGGSLAMQTAQALAEYGDLGPLRQLLLSGDPILASKSAVQLGLRGDREALDTLVSSYEDPELGRFRPFFAIALGLLGDDRGLELLRAGLRAVELRDHCAVAMAGSGHAEDVLFELEFAFDNVDPLVRLRALEALVELGTIQVDSLLERAADDPDARVREVAASARRDRRRRSR
jgi:HEAT repeat protein